MENKCENCSNVIETKEYVPTNKEVEEYFGVIFRLFIRRFLNIKKSTY